MAHQLGLSRIRQVAAGDGHSAAVTAHGKLYTWGANVCGQLGCTIVANEAGVSEGSQSLAC